MIGKLVAFMFNEFQYGFHFMLLNDYIATR